MLRKISLILITLSMLSIQAFTCEVPYDKGINSNFTYRNKQYKTNLPFHKLSKSTKFDINKADFPKQLSEIINAGKKVVRKVDSEIDWHIEFIGLYKYNYSNCTYWYYQMSFRANNNQYLYINVGLNGEQPDIYRIDETLISEYK